jgi:predicted secreted hydrolase
MSADGHVRRFMNLPAMLLLAGLGAAAAMAHGYADLGREASDYEHVTPGRPLQFPPDLGPHPGYRIEWWYVTANLKDQNGAAFGVQWTLFRQALQPGPERTGWANQQVWMGHAALTTSDRHLYAETFARGGVGQAGVVAEPFDAWIDAWRLRSTDSAPGAGLSQLEMTAAGKGFSYRLALKTTKPIVLHGDGGYSVKSERGQASYYFSQPFFEVEGAITIDGEETEVTGHAWMDREWSSQPLASDQSGWDWLALHFEDGEKLMVYRLRHEADSAYVVGTWISSDGTTRVLGREELSIEPLEKQAIAGRQLPMQWALKIKSRGIDIRTVPLNSQSWMGTSFPYWEGPISFKGTHSGVGYLELTGY